MNECMDEVFKATLLREKKNIDEKFQFSSFETKLQFSFSNGKQRWPRMSVLLASSIIPRILSKPVFFFFTNCKMIFFITADTSPRHYIH